MPPNFDGTSASNKEQISEREEQKRTNHGLSSHGPSEINPNRRFRMDLYQAFIFGRRTENFARASSLAEQKFAGSLKCHDSTST